MRNLLWVALLITLPITLAADQFPFQGKWGTDAQCSGELITPKGTKHASPFVVEADWLQNGDVWCRLLWASGKPGQDGAGNVSTDAIAKAICGEDDARDYQLRFRLIDDELTLTWNLWHTNGPLKRCSL